MNFKYRFKGKIHEICIYHLKVEMVSLQERQDITFSITKLVITKLFFVILR